MKKVMKKKKRILSLALAVSTLLPASAYATGGISGGNLSDAAEQAASGIQTEAVGILPYVLLILAVVAGFALIAMGRKGREMVKDQAIPTILGVILIVFAGGVAGWLSGLFH